MLCPLPPIQSEIKHRLTDIGPLPTYSGNKGELHSNFVW